MSELFYSSSRNEPEQARLVLRLASSPGRDGVDVPRDHANTPRAL